MLRGVEAGTRACLYVAERWGSSEVYCCWVGNPQNEQFFFFFFFSYSSVAPKVALFKAKTRSFQNQVFMWRGFLELSSESRVCLVLIRQN